jgi:protein O-GlcNAc transferase
MPKVFAAHSLLEDKIEIRDKSLDKEFIYGSFNNLRKISDETFDVWSEILKITNCKLLLRSSTHDTDELKENVLKKFKERGVDIDQVDISNTIKNRNEHLSSYNNINIALDPFPFPGATTTFESIYMGVPVLTLKGDSSISRFGVTINQNLALEELIAVNKEEYIQKAVNFSQNKSFLNKISGNNLRNKILKSCLFNTDEFTEEFEKVLLNLIN